MAKIDFKNGDSIIVSEEDARRIEAQRNDKDVPASFLINFGKRSLPKSSIAQVTHGNERTTVDPYSPDVERLDKNLMRFPSPYRFENFLDSIGVIRIYRDRAGMDYSVVRPSEFLHYQDIYKALGRLDEIRQQEWEARATPEEKDARRLLVKDRFNRIRQSLAAVKNATAIESQTPVGYQEASPEISPRKSQNLAPQNDEEIPYIDTCPHCMSSVGCNCGETLKNIPF